MEGYGTEGESYGGKGRDFRREGEGLQVGGGVASGQGSSIGWRGGLKMEGYGMEGEGYGGKGRDFRWEGEGLPVGRGGASGRAGLLLDGGVFQAEG